MTHSCMKAGNTMAKILRYHITSTVVNTLPNTSDICSFSAMPGINPQFMKVKYCAGR